MAADVVVARLVGLWRYPVKSMAAEALDEVDVSWHGLAGDRRWAFIRQEQAGNGFPWLTIRQRNDMGRYRPSFAEPAEPDASGTFVRTPSGRVLDVTDPLLAAELGDGARVLRQNRGIFDVLPLSLLSVAAVAGIGTSVGRVLDVQRFRPNLLVDTGDGEPFPEDAWVGAVLRIGGLRMRVDQRDQRCVLVNVDPSTSRRDPEVLRAIAAERQACLGVYGSTVQPGLVRVGDSVIVEGP